MTNAEEQGEVEKALAERVVAATPLFQGLESIAIELGDDFAGDPSMWVVFRMQRDLKTDDPWFDSFTQYNTDLGIKLIHSGVKRFPYSRLERAA